MTSQSLKTKIQKMVETVENVQMLQEIELILAEYLSNHLDYPIEKLSSYEKNLIEKGLQDLQEGKEIPHQTILNQLNEWRKK